MGLSLGLPSGFNSTYAMPVNGPQIDVLLPPCNAFATYLKQQSEPVAIDAADRVEGELLKKMSGHFRRYPDRPLVTAAEYRALCRALLFSAGFVTGDDQRPPLRKLLAKVESCERPTGRNVALLPVEDAHCHGYALACATFARHLLGENNFIGRLRAFDKFEADALATVVDRLASRPDVIMLDGPERALLTRALLFGAGIEREDARRQLLREVLAKVDGLVPLPVP